jgi:1-acyl-sn-glycerol-3-phosphate acyltransferase
MSSKIPWPSSLIQVFLPLPVTISSAKLVLTKSCAFSKLISYSSAISIKRNKITKDNLGFIEDINQMIQTTNRPLIIFPQGTRALPEDRSDFKKGAGRIYEQINVPCQPIAINSGYVWPKKNQKIPNKTITISILKKIDQGLSKENFIQLLQKEIYEELDKIN